VSVAGLVNFFENCIFDGNILRLYLLAKVNRLKYFFLHKLRECCCETSFFKRMYAVEYQRFLRINRVFVDVVNILSSHDVDFAMFKSLRPYPFTTVDIDVIIFKDFEEATETLGKYGYRILGFGPESVTFSCPGGIVNVDLYREVAVSRVVYLDKNVLKKHVTNVMTPYGEIVNLSPEADLIVFANHALVKEHMFTLADYFTIKGLLLKSDVAILSHLILETKSVYVMRIVFGLVKDIIECVYGGREDKCPRLPLKFPPWIVARALWEKRGCAKSRRSWAYQFEYMLSFKRLNRIIRDIVSHITRLTY